MSEPNQLCRACGTMVSFDRDQCTHCGAQLQEHSEIVESSGEHKGWLKTGCLGVLGIFVLLTVIGALFGDPEKQSDKSTTSVPSHAAENVGDASKNSPSSDSSDDQISIGLTGPQINAQRSAEQYLSMSGFSRAGLIEQLSSSAGEGYDITDATVAVDSLNADWNKQAARSAQQYLDMMGFSCSGLIDQLSSNAGEKYTASQARFGAEQAGAC